ncbi:MAG: DUF3644 domain-containing protein [Rhodospirillaceae bacterium]|nr:DUF3644 domain-containing protein [Rhodospirillaceae bacterium]MDE0255047.1 DUF3644 domain-containing protein [Rhodospirillaceae bacterium]MDE0619448.1 DUF3644 domain-containing protein [Rhodospirillaceae bacterium]
MPKKKHRHDLENWEVALVKAMLKKGNYNDQEILAFFTRPTRTINHRVIGEIRKGIRRGTVVPVTANELNEFLVNWPRIDSSTGLSIDNDELLIKAREAMIAAVHIFNSAGLNFRAELFIVTAVIAWTYLMHAYFKREKIDYRHYKHTNGKKTIEATNCGAERYWDLSRCLRADACPLEKGIKRNLEFLIEIRHEIEHRSTNRIDEAISAKLQACCLNFNNSIKRLFGQEYGLEKRLPIALQFVTFSSEQAGVIIGARHLPEHIETMINKFHESMTLEEQIDPSFAYRVAFVQKSANRVSSSDMAIEFVKPGSEEEAEINRVLLKEVEKPKYRPSDIVNQIQGEGYNRFTISKHTDLWKALDAKNPKKNLGVLISGQWYWYDSWLKIVREYCRKNAEDFMTATEVQEE